MEQTLDGFDWNLEIDLNEIFSVGEISREQVV